jgi:hypothetical protein
MESGSLGERMKAGGVCGTGSGDSASDVSNTLMVAFVSTQFKSAAEDREKSACAYQALPDVFS